MTDPVPSTTDVTPGMTPTPASLAPISTGSPVPPSPPANQISENSASPRFYTITASLREEYDDNIYTTKDNRTGSFVTEFSPSILFNVPMQDSTFSGRYTFGLDYYAHTGNGKSLDYTHEALIRYTHNFSNRFSLDARDQFGYYYEPDLQDAVGTPFQNGDYFANTGNFQFDAQWTPLFGTETTYSNIALFYQEANIAQYQNSDENTVGQDFRFAFLPKFNFIAGGIFDNMHYFDYNRGYSNFTLDAGLDWQALPNLSFGVRAGATLTEPDGAADSITPYAAATVDWRLGKRSNLAFSYTHNVVPTDVIYAVGQEADRFSLRFSYDLTSRITMHIEGIETYADYDSELLQAGSSIPSFTENDVGVDLGAEYHFNANFGLEAGYLLSDVSSEQATRDYVRNQVYVGVRGTY